jgi:hypothetical protein
MEIPNSLVALMVLVAIVISVFGTMTTIDVLDRLSGIYPVQDIDEDTTGFISGLVNVTVNESISINWIISELNFTLNTRESSIIPFENNTETGYKQSEPFQIRNDGSTNVNISMYAGDHLWAQTPIPTPYFEFKCGNNESQCDNCSHCYPNSTINWTNVTYQSANATLVAFNFSYVDGAAPNGDEIVVHINVSVPPNEQVGVKTSTITITGVTACTGDANCDSWGM